MKLKATPPHLFPSLFLSLSHTHTHIHTYIHTLTHTPHTHTHTHTHIHSTQTHTQYTNINNHATFMDFLFSYSRLQSTFTLYPKKKWPKKLGGQGKGVEACLFCTAIRVSEIPHQFQKYMFNFFTCVHLKL